jgi:hypothetical protein
MTPKQAKEILLGMLDKKKLNWSISPTQLYGLSPYANCYPKYDGEVATLDGEFTADQLEAIATWMRDPNGVAEE